MAPLRCLPLTVTIAALALSAPAMALQAMDDHSLSDVTGQAQGLRITEQQEMVIDSLSYIDDDGLGTDGTVGTITLSNIRQFTPPNRPTVRDFEVKQTAKGQALVMTSRELAITREVGDIAINGKSLGAYGQDNYSFAAGDTLVTSIYAGGYGGGNGLSIDVDVPSSLSYDNWHEINGVKQYVTINYDDPYNKGHGGIFYENITIDIVDDGIRVGLPTISNGFINQYNECVGSFKSCRDPEIAKHNVTTSTAYRNINVMPDGYALIKNAKGANEIGLEFDLVVKQGTNLDYVYIFGEVGNNYPNSSVFEMSAHVDLLSDLSIEGMRMNVDGERGLVFDFDNSTNPGAKVASANIGLSNITLQRSDKVGVGPAPVSLGTLDLQLNLTNNSYVQIEGY